MQLQEQSETAVSAETIIEPELPIVDAHHHLWFLPDTVLSAMESKRDICARALTQVFRCRQRYLFDELIADFRQGHNIRASVFIDASAMYRAGGPKAMRSVGEIEFVNGVAAMAESGLWGDIQACAGIVGGVDLTIGAAVEEVLLAHIQAGGSRYRGIRASGTMYDEDGSILGSERTASVLSDSGFRQGFKLLRKFGLTFDALLLEPQLPDLVHLAQKFPDQQIVLNHTGIPVGVGRYAGQRQKRFPIWRECIRRLAACENVAVKLGGLGLPFAGFELHRDPSEERSMKLAVEWRPYIETCIERFGPDRCMFVSNFPVDCLVGSYAAVWNVFKRITAGSSPSEKRSLFSGTATRVYKLEIGGISDVGRQSGPAV